MSPYLKYKTKKKFFFLAGQGGGGGGGVKNPNLKEKKFFFEGDGGRGRWMYRQTSPNQLAPSTSSKLGA